MLAASTIRGALIAAALALGPGGAAAVGSDAATPEPGSSLYRYESSFGGTFHPNGRTSRDDDGTEVVQALGFGSANFHPAPGEAGELFQQPGPAALSSGWEARDPWTPSLAELSQINGPPIAGLFTFDPASPDTRFEAIAEPAALLPLLVGLLGVGFARWRRRHR